MTIAWIELAKAAARSVWELRHPDGSLYLRRTVLHGVDSLDNHDSMVPWSAFIHEIHTADGDRHLHDHPWAWSIAVVLSGGYTESRPFSRLGGKVLTYGPGDLNVLRSGDYHSIVDVLPDTTTLFLCGREISDWGFLVNGAHVPHREYFERDDVQCMSHARVDFVPRRRFGVHK